MTEGKMAGTPIIRIKNLKKDYKIRSSKLGQPPRVLHALSGVSLDLFQGETLGVIGESGCGKSTLGKCLVQLTRPTAGEILYNGQNLCALSNSALKPVRKELQMVFQDPYSSLDPRFTTKAAIEEPLIIHGLERDSKKRRETVLAMLREVGLDVQHMDRYPHEFSGGQRQRINVARALVLQPKVIVCDEPVSALDVSVQAQVLNLFSSLQKRHNLTYIFISHDLSVIKHISDRVAIMYLGTVVELCDADEIYQNPRHPYTKALLSAIPPDSPFEKSQKLTLSGEIPSPIGDLVGCPLAGRCPERMPVCSQKRPALKEISPGHRAACFLYHQEEYVEE